MRITKMWEQDIKGTDAVGKIPPGDVLKSCNKPSICKEQKNILSAKCNKMRYACTPKQ